MPLLVIQELAFILQKEDLCKLTDGCHASCIEQSPDQQWLVHVAHDHLIFEKINEFFVGHGSGRIVVRFRLLRVAGFTPNSCIMRIVTPVTGQLSPHRLQSCAEGELMGDVSSVVGHLKKELSRA